MDTATISAERALNALGDPTRRLVFKRLVGGTRSVKEIADGLDVSRPSVSQHLKVLKDAGLARVRIEGTRHLYAVDMRGVAAVRRWFDEFWDTALIAFKRAAEREASKRRKP
jgi:DNA-binding transcriptional ArsR family regulator